MSAERREKKGRFVMTMSTIVTDEQLGKYFRKMTAIRDRLGKSLPFEKVMHALQEIHDGEFNAIVKIDRTKPFDFSYFRGSANDGSDRIIEQNEASLALTLIDCERVVFANGMYEREKDLTGDERIKRLKSEGYILLDAKVLFTLCEHEHLIPDSWKYTDDNEIRYIFFDGTICESKNLGGVRYVFILHWIPTASMWGYIFLPLYIATENNYVSAVLRKQ